MTQDSESNKIKKQNIPLTIGGLIASAISGIVGYIAVYFFKPVWEKIVRWWKKCVLPKH